MLRMVSALGQLIKSPFTAGAQASKFAPGAFVIFSIPLKKPNPPALENDRIGWVRIDL